MNELAWCSYDRIQPNTWSGAYQCWGKENREAPLRTSCPPGIQEGRVSNFELKSFDGCANPYLGLAAIAAAGIDGLRGGLPLPNPIGKTPKKVSDCEMSKYMHLKQMSTRTLIFTKQMLTLTTSAKSFRGCPHHLTNLYRLSVLTTFLKTSSVRSSGRPLPESARYYFQNKSPI